jgi:peptidoglycan hydrolase-like protein with peptidoglycan-binding domain
MPLQSKHFRSNARAESAASNSPAMSIGEQGRGVKLLQEALIETGIPMPRSTHGGKTPADGIFGPETKAAVTECQTRFGLMIDGIAGRQTFTALDEFMLERERETPARLNTSRWAMTTARKATH